MGGLSIWHWLIVLVIVLAVFGTSKLKNIGKDLGGAVKNFKDAVREGEQEKPEESSRLDSSSSPHVIEGEVKEKSQH